METGHSWSNVKHYTLSEIGIFLRAVIKRKPAKHADALALAWMGNNLSKEGLEQAINGLSTIANTGKETVNLTKEEVGKEWRRLAAFMRSPGNG